MPSYCPKNLLKTHMRPSIFLQVALASAELAAIPAVVMLLGSVATILSSSPPPKIVAHALQHLAGGIMLAAISMELVPPQPVILYAPSFEISLL